MQYQVIGPNQAANILSGLAPIAPVYLDLETYGPTPADGLDPVAGSVRLVSFRSAEHTNVWIADLKRGDAAAERELYRQLVNFPLVCHNAQFDLGWLIARGHFPANRTYCTSILAKLVLAGVRGKAYAIFQKPSLVNCCRWFLKRERDKAEQASDWGRPTLTESQLRYAATDVEVLQPLMDALVAEVVRLGLTRAARIEMDAIPMVAWANVKGVPFDAGLWAVPFAQAQAKQEELFRRLRSEYVSDAVVQMVPGPREKQFGRGKGQIMLPYAADQRALAVLGSPTQLKELLRILLGRSIPTTNDDFLAELDHPLAELIRDWRECATVVKMFGPTWGRKAKADDERAQDKPNAVRRGRLHPSLYQLGTETGRMQYDYPNISQVPAPGRHPLGKGFRSAFRAPPGRELVVADFSQIELRLAAEISGDRAMREVYERGGDIHTEGATWVLGVKEPTKHQRQIMKSANFGLLYGAGIERFRSYARAKFDVRLTPEQAAEIREGWFKAFPGVRQWQRDTSDDLKRAGPRGLTTRTLAGRARQQVGAWREGERDNPPGAYSEALNSPVQGSGADLLKLALASLYASRTDAPTADWFPVLYVHDEIVLEVPEGSGKEMAQWLRAHMIEAGSELMPSVPTDASAGVYPAWLKE
jgi:DNA polymerase I-like protein with 3'-5' exonuclease and polymerase domains